ncbi:MAG: translocation/assembly module TamB domain-containing protein, partial [Bacteroidota bacterium]
MATINKLEFNKINLASPNDSIHDLSSNLQIKLSGNNIDNFSGRIDVSNSVYHLNGKKYKLKDFNLFLDQKQEQKSINLASSIADINVDGKFNISDLQNSFRQYLEKYFPTLIREKRIPKGKVFTDHFNYSITINNFSLINGLFLPDLIVGKGTEISGNYDASKSELSLKGSSKKIQFKDFKINDWTVAINSLSQSIEINTGARRLFLTDSLYVTNFNFNSSSFDNQSGFHLNWDNNGNKKYAGDIAGSVNFLNSNIQLGLTKMDLTVNDSLWALKDTSDFIKIDTTGKIVIQRLTLRNNSQMLKIDGAISNLPNEDLIVEVDNFKISQFNPVLSSAGLKFDGILEGKAKLSRVNEKIVFSSEFSFTDFFLNDRLMGNGNILSIYNTEKDFISINGFFKKTNNTSNLTNGNSLNVPVTGNNIEFNGYYYPSKKENNIDLSVLLSKLDIAIIQPYLKDILSFPSMQGGALNGKVSVKGSVSKPLLEGRLLVNIKNLKVDYLNTFYNATGIVHIDSNKVCLGDEAPENGEAPSPIFLFDREGHTATVWGNIFHDNFKITKLDFDINTNNFMVLNTTPKNNPDYFGKAYVTGSVGIYGNLDQMNMEINLKTEKNTEFNIPLSGPATVEENNFIIFLNKDTTKKNSNVYQKSLSGINLDLNLEATPDATVKMIFDSKSGDVISARGNGNIKMVINTNGKFEMYGLYTLTNGDYMFSLENILSKKFEIISGSTVKWAGDPLNADINITAGYNQNSSLTPFFPSDSTGRYSKPVKASVLLNMNGKLMNPDIGFGVSLPSVDETTRQTVLSYLNNEQEMNRQVFSLLLLKSFVTPLQLSNQGVGLGAGSTASRTSSEMLSNQLSNWLSQLNTGVDISVNITPEQMDVALSK